MPRTVDHVETATAERPWQKPEPRWGVDSEGRRVRLYQCLLCNDLGLVTLPSCHPGETPEDLVSFQRLLQGRRYSYPCPACRGIGESLCSKHPSLPDGHRRRLRLWLEARRQQLDREQVAGAHDPVKPGRLPRVGRDMPPLSLFGRDAAQLEAAAASGCAEEVGG